MDDAALDADSDGLSNIREFQLGTNPQNPDTDSDGLSNIDELLWGTDPTNPDTDDDGVSDGDEVAAGTDPTLNIGAVMTIIIDRMMND